MPFIKLSDSNEHEPIPGYRVRFVHSSSMTFAYWSIMAGAELPEHSHPHEQVAHVIEGEFELVIEGEIQRLRPGMIAVIPSNAIHSGRAVSNCRLLDAFHPVREDYVAKWR